MEVTGAYALIEGALWTLGWAQFLFALLTLIWVVSFSVLEKRSLRELGLSGQTFWRVAWVVPAAVALGAGMVTWAQLAGTFHVPGRWHFPLLHSLLYCVWALVQQFLAQSFFFIRIEEALGSSGRAVLMTAALFSLAHFPNIVLMLATMMAGASFSELFRRYRTIYPLAVAHGLLGLAVSVSFPDYVLHGMRVGIAYYAAPQ